MARDERATQSSIGAHQRRAALARRRFALELDTAAIVTRRATRGFVPLLYGLAAFGALLAVVAVVRLTRKPVPALVRITIPPAPPAVAARSSVLNAVLRASLERGALLTLARLALQRFAAKERQSLRGLLPALSSIAASSLARLDDRERDLAARARDAQRRP